MWRNLKRRRTRAAHSTTIFWIPPHILGRHIRTDMCRDTYPFSGHVFVFRGRRGDLIKLLWWDGDGLCLFAKRLEKGRFVWPKVENGTVALTRAQLSMLLEGIDWRRPVRTYTPELSV